MLLDISQPVTPRTAGFPGDEPFSCGWTATLAAGAGVNVAWVKTSTHVGTHVDAPYHYDERGARVGAFDPEVFVGACVVDDAVGRAQLDVDAVRGIELRGVPRVLFKTRDRSDAERFHHDFPVPTEALVAHLAAAHVRLVGLDAPSFDRADSKGLPIHHALGRAGIANVENLVLDGVSPGRYELLAAPVRWVDLDAAPIRALLRR